MFDFAELFRDTYRLYPEGGLFVLELGEINSDGKASVPFLGKAQKFYFANEFAAKNAVEAVAGVLNIIDSFINDCDEAIGSQLGENVQLKVSTICAAALAEVRNLVHEDELPF